MDLNLGTIKIKTKAIKILMAEGMRLGRMIIMMMVNTEHLLDTRHCTKISTSITLFKALQQPGERSILLVLFVDEKTEIAEAN